MAFTVFSRFTSEAEGLTLSGTCVVKGDIVEHEGREAAQFDFELRDETDDTSINLSYFITRTEDGGIEVTIPNTGEPVTDFAICIGTRVGGSLLGAAYECGKKTMDFWEFLECMKEKAPGLGMRALINLFRCAGKAVWIDV